MIAAVDLGASDLEILDLKLSLAEGSSTATRWREDSLSFLLRTSNRMRCEVHRKSLLNLERLAQVSKEQLPLFRVHLREVLEPPLNGG